MHAGGNRSLHLSELELERETVPLGLLEVLELLEVVPEALLELEELLTELLLEDVVLMLVLLLVLAVPQRTAWKS